MKNLLIVAATEPEIAPFLRFLEANFRSSTHHVFQNEQYTIEILISGVGMMATAFHLSARLATQHYDAALQAGIAGCFNTDIPLGTVLGVSMESYGDLGAEDHDRYLDIFELGFLEKNGYPFQAATLPNPQPYLAGAGLQMVPAISVNTVSGCEATISARAKRYKAQLESMEGLAFHYACRQYQIPFLQIRAVSNYVTPRDRSAWQIGTAISNLNGFLQEIFSN